MTYQAGQKLGNYQLIRLLGEGGFAEVYLGKHMYLDTHAAIKVLQRQSDNEALESFLQEARIIASLKHPHIVGVLEFGIEEQRPFLVMEYAMYGTLRQRYLRGYPLSPTAILPCIRQVAEALQYAHERKIIHRDVKPENMLLDRNHRVLLSDFGLALRTRSSYHSIDYADSGGTISYMSPEQLQGKPGAASDQYALGVVMYEWLCGCLPFDGPDVSIVVQHLHEPPVPLRTHVPSLSPEVEAVVLRALEKDPKQRFATVQELAEAFEKACKGLPASEEMDAAHYKDALITSESGELLQDEVSNTAVRLLPGRVQDEIPQRDAITPLLWPAPSPSLQARSLDASPNVNRPLQNTQKADSLALTASKSIPTSQKRARISRRTVAVGIAGLVLGGVGIWRLGAIDNVTHSINAQAAQGGGSSVTVPGITANRQKAGKSGTSGTPTTGRTASPPANGNGTAKSGVTNPATAGKSGQTGTTPTPTSSNGGGSVATSTPGTSGVTSTPVATNAPGTPPLAALTLQLKHVPSSVRNHTTVNISVATNMSALSFQFEADYYDVFGNMQQQQQSDILNGTTDNNGNATVSWTPTLLPSVLLARNYANLYVTAADQNGHTISSRHVRVQITSF